jgi:hypothetical protein
MNVVWHDREGMQQIVPEGDGVVLDGFNDHVCDGGERPGREGSVGRQSVVQTPREENGLISPVVVRKSAPVERHTG